MQHTAVAQIPSAWSQTAVPRLAEADLSILKSVDPAGIILPNAPLTYTLSVTNHGPDSSLPFIYTNPLTVTIPDSGVADPYPSTISIPPMSASILQAEVALHGIGHTFPDDVDILLVGPGGQNSILMSDAGGGTNVTDLELNFSDSALQYLPDITQLFSGVYLPTEYDSTDTFPAPAPVGPYGTHLSVFNGLNPTGDWDLYVYDDTGGDLGLVADGWTLTLTLFAARVSDTLPGGVSVADIIAPDWACDQVGQLLTCDIASLPAGFTSQIVILAQAPAITGIITNTATVDSPLSDPDPNNNLSLVANLVDSAPLAEDDAYITYRDTSLVVPAPGVLDNDFDPDMDLLSAALLLGPQHGSLSQFDPDGAFTYTPTPGYVGLDFFTYELTDGYLADTAQVNITVEDATFAIFIPFLSK